MVKVTVAICILTMSFLSCSQAVKPTSKINENINQTYIPPGTIKLVDTMFIDKQPVD